MTNTPEQRLAQAGLDLPPAPAPPVAAYVPATHSRGQAFTSGQLPMREGSLVAVGTVGANVDVATAVECAQQSVLNALAAIRVELGSLNRVAKVIKLTVFVSATPAFKQQPAVADGASNVLFTAFGEAGRHARSAVGVASLPLGAPTEVELIVETASGS